MRFGFGLGLGLGLGYGFGYGFGFGAGAGAGRYATAAEINAGTSPAISRDPHSELIAERVVPSGQASDRPNIGAPPQS